MLLLLGGPAFAQDAWVESDRDGDGIVDGEDRCPLEPEDKDGFQDADGCPEPDNDGDGVVDARDHCPFDPEDKDGFEDGDGCPEPDNDRDGIADARDMCPQQPEIVNGFEDDDGCPDKAPAIRPAVRETPPVVRETPPARVAPAVKKRRADECSGCWSSKCPELEPYLVRCE